MPEEHSNESKRRKEVRAGVIIIALAVIAAIAAVIVGVPYVRYQRAGKLMNEASVDDGASIARAAIAFGQLGGLKDSRERSLALWDAAAVRETVSAGMGHLAVCGSDGLAVATGVYNEGQCEVDGWTDIIAVSAGGGHTAGQLHTVGLKADGTVVATGWENSGRCGVQDWTGITAVAARNDFTLGLRSDGTVVAAGGNEYGQCDVGGWSGITAISAGFFSAGVTKDGEILLAGPI